MRNQAENSLFCPPYQGGPVPKERRGSKTVIYVVGVGLFSFGISFAFLIFGCSARKARPTQLRVHPIDWEARHSSFIFSNALQPEYGTACQSCHGTDYTGGTSEISCVGCHNQRQDVCIGCHGGNPNSTGMPTDFTGAPPASLIGRKEDTARGVGGHLAMVNGRSLFTGTDCQTCHIKPAFVLASTHFTTSGQGADGRAEVVFSGVAQIFASRYGAPTFDTLSGSCANIYCHGAFPGGNTTDTVDFYGGSAQAFCGSCHAVDSNFASLSGKHNIHNPNNPDTLAPLQCITCHFSTADVKIDSSTVPFDTLVMVRLVNGRPSPKHVNGVFDVDFNPSIAPLGLFDGVSCNGMPDKSFNFPSCHANKEDW